MSETAVVTSLPALKQGISDELLNQAFGPESLGIILINQLPVEYKVLREKVLKSATLLSRLEKGVLDDLESPEAYWLVGWSLGKEKLTVSTTSKEGVVETVKKPDYLKGSYYINCSFFINKDLEGPPEQERLKYEKHKAYTTLNKWPRLDSLKDAAMANFEHDSKELCKLIISICLDVARACDKYIAKNLETSRLFPADYLQLVVKNSYTTKARLLHYYPKNKKESEEESSNTWCGEHLDHSCLTGLTSPMYLDESKLGTSINSLAELKELGTSPDPEAGLYIKNRRNEIVKVEIPVDCLAFQTGSALQEISQNRFKAVPHYVKGCSHEDISRNTLAVFCQPNLGNKVNQTETFSQYADRILNINH